MISRVAADVLSDRALNRATLERQLLLRRSSLSPLEAVEHLVGLQAQVPLNPYTALWSRLAGFRPEELARLLEERALVRIVVMRGTIHLVTADDALLLRPLTQPVLDGQLARHNEHKAALAGVNLEPVVEFARALFAEEPRTPRVRPRAALARRPHAIPLAEGVRGLLTRVDADPGTVLHDGYVAGTWRIERDRESDAATLVVDHIMPLSKRSASSVAAEGRRFLRFIAADAAAHDVHFVAVE